MSGLIIVRIENDLLSDEKGISSQLEHHVIRKLECRKNIVITCTRHMNTSVVCKHTTSSMKDT